MINLILKKYAKDSSPTDQKVRGKIGKLSGAVGIVSNVFLAIIKLFAGIISSSVSITADALNNLSDAASSIITLIGFKLTEKPADADHPYGHARYEYISALAVSAIIIVIGFELGKSSVEKILSPTPTTLSLVSGGILILSIIIKLALYFFNRGLGRAIESDTLIATATDSRNDVIATTAVLLATLVERFTDLKIDGIVGLFVAIFILYSGVSLARVTVSPLLGEATSPELKRLIVDYIESCPKVLGYHDLMVHDYGMGRRFASIHVEMDRCEDPLLCHELIDDMERECLESHGVELVIHYDPIVVGDPEIENLKGDILTVLKERDERISIHDFRMVMGEGHTNLIFDAVLPEEERGHEKEIKALIENALFEKHSKKYYTVITFDLEEFN